MRTLLLSNCFDVGLNCKPSGLSIALKMFRNYETLISKAGVESNGGL